MRHTIYQVKGGERLLDYANLSEKDAKLLLEDAKRRKELAESMRIFSNVGSFF